MVIGRAGPQTVNYARKTGTGLCLETDLEDNKADADQISSGLYPPAVGVGPGRRVRLGLRSSDGSGRTWWSSGPAEFSRIITADLDDSGTASIRSARARQFFPPRDLPPDGRYTVVVENLRDAAGNEGPDGHPDGELADWSVALR
jgi:hypothetical protein